MSAAAAANGSSFSCSSLFLFHISAVKKAAFESSVNRFLHEMERHFNACKFGTGQSKDRQAVKKKDNFAYMATLSENLGNRC
jgi:hypothetical protein